MNEEAYKKELADNGVDLPELQEEKKEETPDTPVVPKEPESPEPEKTEPEEPKEPLQTEPKEDRKRSIYDEYKEKKAELKSERELREQAERERDEWKAKAEAVKDATTPEEKKEAMDDFEAFAQKINADPATIREMYELFSKDLKKPTLTEADQKALEDARQLREEKLFNEEFDSMLPSLKEQFPSISDDEIKAIKKELDNISHSKEWHDKSLDYIAFKHKDQLAKLVSPKKRGLEPKSPKDAPVSPEFDPTADLSKMTPAELDAWETQYRALGKSQGITTDAQGRKILV